MIILGIETSCDETAAAVIRGEENNIKVLSDVVSSQIEIHKKYGGVVPEVAAREHVLNILPVVHESLTQASISRPDIIAVTVGPGLITSLLVGVETAKSLGFAWGLPIVAVNHIEGHIYANFVCVSTKSQIPNITFPALILTVSGGHTSLVLMKGHGKYEVIGETRDDAAGEAFDKAAKMMGLGYPGGPEIAKMSNVECLISNGIKLPRPMIDSSNFDFSFSGLKTALLYSIQKDQNYKLQISNYCYEFQEAVVDVLVKKTIKAAKKYNVKSVMLSGGVAANARLRERLQAAVKDELPGTRFSMPDLKYTTDNAVMIATAGYFNALRKNYTAWDDLKVDCNLKLGV